MKNEEKLSAQVLESRRKRAIGLRLRGMKNPQVSEIVGLSQQTISTYYAKYKREGEGALKSKERGRPRGTGKKLTKNQEREIIFLLLDRNLKLLKFDNTLWTRETIQEFIKRELRIEIPTSTLGDYLREWGLISIKPKKKSHEREDREEGSWLALKFPGVRQEAKEDDAYIWWGFMTASKEKNSKFNLMTVMTHTGKAKFYLYEKSLDMDTLIDFMKQVRKSSDKKVYIIVDNHNLMKRDEKLMRLWDKIKKREGRIFLIPSSQNK